MKRILLASLLLAATAHAETTYQRLLAHVQETYLPGAAPYPILIMDRDDLEWRFTRASAVADADAKARADIVKAYVLEKTGVAISDNAAANFEPYLAQLGDAAIAMPALKDGTNEIAMCAVFPPDPNRNQRLETERLVQLRTLEAYGKRDVSELRETLGYDDAVLFSVLHESGHCMDSTYFPKLAGGEDDASILHGAESFAETAGLFLMAKEGRADVAAARAYLRDLYSYFMEPYFAAHPELGFGADAFSYGGLIYHLSPSLRAAAEHLEAVKSLALPELLALAKDIVEKNALGGREITALYAGYTDGHDAALERYRGYETQDPDLFGGIPGRMQAYWQAESDFRAGAFGPAAAPAPVTPLKAFDQDGACELLRRGDYDGLRSMLETLRQDLRTGAPAPDAAEQRFELLSNLWKALPSACHGGAAFTRTRAPALILDAVAPRR